MKNNNVQAKSIPGKTAAHKNGRIANSQIEKKKSFFFQLENNQKNKRVSPYSVLTSHSRSRRTVVCYYKSFFRVELVFSPRARDSPPQYRPCNTKTHKSIGKIYFHYIQIYFFFFTGVRSPSLCYSPQAPAALFFT